MRGARLRGGVLLTEILVSSNRLTEDKLEKLELRNLNSMRVSNCIILPSERLRMEFAGLRFGDGDWILCFSLLVDLVVRCILCYVYVFVVVYVCLETAPESARPETVCRASGRS